LRIIDKSGGKQIDFDTLDDDTLAALGQWRQSERMRSDSARGAIEREWALAMEMYEGVATKGRDLPMNNGASDMPSIEMTIGAIAVDNIYANLIELIYQSEQLISVVPRKSYEDYSDAVQDFIDWGCREAFGVDEAISSSTLDCIKLGPMAFYIPYVEKIKVTDTYKVIDRGPKIIALPCEDFHLPEGSSGNIQTDSWVSMDMWLTEADLALYAKSDRRPKGWNTEGIDPAANISPTRQKRLNVASEQSSAAASGKLYQIEFCCGEYDIDDDGLLEEIEIISDVTTNRIMSISFPKYDKRPFEFTSYQIRSHVAWGLGVMKMSGPFEDEVSILHNERVINVRLANSRMWRAAAAVKSFLDRIWPGKVIQANKDEVEGLKMGDIYPSTTQAEMMTIAFAERRTGVSDLQASQGKLGTRTPGVSAMAYMQSANRRFTPAFRNMRGCIADAVRQCLYRVQERVKANDKAAIQDVRDVLGDKADKFLELMNKVDNLIDAVDIQVTATSISINREADRQSMSMLMQVAEKYYQSRIQLEQSKAMAPTKEMHDLITAIDAAVVKLMRRYLRTFETISDVDAYLAEVDGINEMAKQLPPQAQGGLNGLTQMLQDRAQTNGPQPQQQDIPPTEAGGIPIQ
jgi:hypothetical protein